MGIFLSLIIVFSYIVIVELRPPLSTVTLTDFRKTIAE